MNADWAALNAAQQAAMIIWIPLALVLGWKIVTLTLDRRWPLPLVFVGTFVMVTAGVAALILMLGEVPK